MFTGIVEEIGTVLAVQPLGDSASMRIRGRVVTTDAGHGDSIAVNGVCLTVTDTTGANGGEFSVDVMGETLQRTSLGRLAPGSPVNLERALPAHGRLGGHVVQGHVDGVGYLADRQAGQRWDSVRFTVPHHLARYLAEKGSITVDGVSLTVVGVSAPGDEDAWFSVGLIPTTLQATTLGRLAVGDPVNLEVDVLAKYVERLAAFDRAVDAGDERTVQQVQS